MLETAFNKVTGLQLSSEYCEIFKKNFFHKKRLVAASERFINFLEKHQWREA